MAVTELQHVDLGGLEAVVGERSLTRGRRYVAEDRVMRIDWDAVDKTLIGTVYGQGEVYETAASFGPGVYGPLEFDEGECTCPVEYNCKHVAAIVLAAVGAGPARLDARDRPASRPGRRVAEPTWEQSLWSLMGSATVASDSEIPLAIELTLESGVGSRPSAGARRLTARLLRPGRKGWVNGGLAWGGLESWQVQHAGYATDHLRVVRQMYALHRAVSGTSGYHYAGADRTIDLGGLDSTLWPLLDEGSRVGLRLVHADGSQGEVGAYRCGKICLDITRPEQEMVVSPALTVDDHDDQVDPVPVAFLGSTGHGVVYVDRTWTDLTADPSGWRLHLARLAQLVPAPLRQMVVTGRRVEVPAAGRARFAEDIWPRLRHVAPVVSSDGSFTPPPISGPTLVLRAAFGAGHTVEVDWEWAYRVGATDHRVELDADAAGAGYRDVNAERALVRSLDAGLEQFGLLTADGVGLRPGRFSGLDTMRFATEVLPLLTDQPGVAVERAGEPADFREVGDSLVIGVSTDDAAGETDWFDLGVTITVEGRDVPFAEVFVALASGQTDMLLADGAYFSLLKPELQALRRVIEEARALQDSPSGPLRISRFHAGMWDELAQLGVVHHQAEAWKRQVGALLALDSIDTPDVPDTLDAQLRPYQRDGFGWLAFLWQHRLGGILADDMGLGKTVQTLALICRARQADPVGPPFLVVAPTSVVSNWAAEAARFAPGLRVAALTDTLRRAGRSIEQIVDGADVVVTTYTLFRLDHESYNSTGWAGLILDEAQYAKNHRSKVYGCIRQLAAPFKLAITGTPMENNLMELWSLLSITAPGLFPSPTRFAEYYARPIERRGDVELLAQFRRRIKPLVKRRTKEQVAVDLPAKQEQVLEVELHPRHRKIYQTHLQRERQKVLGLIEDFNRNQFTILRSLTLMRQLSLHPDLVPGDHGAVPCAKLDTLVDHLGEVVEGRHRALVFSQFTRFLAQVRTRLDAEGIDHCYLDGRTRRRDAVLRRFKEGAAPVFLISLKAGGFGLNLTEADYCFLLDPWWNPATEAQAIDRTHRIGQTRNVMVYRLIARDTVEEKVMVLKQRKAELFGGVMDEGDLFGGSLDADDIRGLFT